MTRRGGDRGEDLGALTLAERIVLGWCGPRGAVSLAVVLSLPLTVHSAPFAHRDLLVFLTVVVLATLVGQVLPLPALPRALRLRPTERERTEGLRARRVMVDAALRDIEELAEAAECEPADRDQPGARPGRGVAPPGEVSGARRVIEPTARVAVSGPFCKNGRARLQKAGSASVMSSRRETRVVADPESGSAGQGADLVVTRPRSGSSVVEVRCELDMLTAPSLTRVLGQQFAEGCQVLVVDLSGCEFMGSSGLAVLVETRERANDTSARLALVGLTRITSRALRATGIEGLFSIYPSAAEAVAALDGERAP